MDKSESFMNWGFNPNSGRNPTPYYLVFGGATEDMEAWSGMAKFSKLEDALIQLFECWDDWTPWIFDDLRNYVGVGEGVNLRNDDGRIVEAYLKNLYFVQRKSKTETPSQRDNIGLVKKLPEPKSHLINPKINKDEIEIRKLVTLSGLREAESTPEYLERVRKEYEDYIKNSPVIQDYIQNLDSLAKQGKKICNSKWQVNRNNIYHDNFTICELKHWLETSGNCWKIIFSP